MKKQFYKNSSVVLLISFLLISTIDLLKASMPQFGHYGAPYQFFTVYESLCLSDIQLSDLTAGQVDLSKQYTAALITNAQPIATDFFIQIIGTVDVSTDQKRDADHAIRTPWNVVWHAWALGHTQASINITAGLLGCDGIASQPSSIALNGLGSLNVHIHGNHYSPNNGQFSPQPDRQIITFFPTAQLKPRTAFGMTLLINDSPATRHSLQKVLSDIQTLTSYTTDKLLMIANILLYVAQGVPVTFEQLNKPINRDGINNFHDEHRHHSLHARLANSAETLDALNTAIHSITNPEDRKALTHFVIDMLTTLTQLHVLYHDKVRTIVTKARMLLGIPQRDQPRARPPVRPKPKTVELLQQQPAAAVADTTAELTSYDSAFVTAVESDAELDLIAQAIQLSLELLPSLAEEPRAQQLLLTPASSKPAAAPRETELQRTLRERREARAAKAAREEVARKATEHANL